MRLTELAIRQLPLPAKGQKTYWDDALKGFGCRVSQGGTRSFVLQFGADRQLVTIGKYHADVLPLGKARAEAKRVLAEHVLGKHRPKSITFADAKDEFLAFAARKNRPRTVYDYTRLLNRHFAFGRRRLIDISASDLTHKLNRIKAPAERNYATTVIKNFFNFAYRQHYVDSSPAGRLQTRPSRPRSRTLSSEELTKALKLALATPSAFNSIFALLALTGQRRGEISALEWSWIDADQRLITLPATATKNGRPHTFPIGPTTLAILADRPQLKDNPYVFPAARSRHKHKPATTFNGWSKQKAAFDKELAITPYTLHDLRRTFRTRWAELGISREVAERYINHVSGVHSGIQAVYDRHTYLPEMRTAVDRWEAHIAALLARG